MSEQAPARAWRVVLEKIEGDLSSGTLQPGDRLAPERELAATLGVGRSSVREALRVLEVMGLIRTATGSGPTAGAIIVATPQGGLAQFLRLQVAAQGFPISDVVETRLLLERWTVGQLAMMADCDLVAAHATIRAMAAEDLSPQDFLALDAQFHLRMAEAAGNQIVSATMAGLRTAIEGYVLEGAEHVEDWAGMSAQLIGEHRGILTAIENGDIARAQRLVLEHITGYYSATGLPTGA